MSKEIGCMPQEVEFRKRFRTEYGTAADLFFKRIFDEGFEKRELEAVPSLFLPGCGKFYADSLIKVGIVGEGTNWWGNSLWTDLDDYKEGEYDYEYTFRELDRSGPTSWKNNFWKSVAEMFNVVFATHDALDGASPIFRGIAWSNSYQVEKYKPDGAGGCVDVNGISQARHSRIQQIADECGLSSFERFIKVFCPNVIIYTVRNNYDSDRVFPFGMERVEQNIHPKEGCPWAINVFKYGKMLIVQTQHPSWCCRNSVKRHEFGKALADVLIRYKVFPPPSREKFHNDSNEESFAVFSELLNDEADRLIAGGCCVDNRETSYRLILALADQLRKTDSTMAAVTMTELLNTVKKFRKDNWLYSSEGRGPCSVVRGAWNYFENEMKDEKSAAKIADAFTKLDGTYAYLE